MSAGVVIAGGGLAAQRCAETLRRAGFAGRVRMICAEPHPPYDRPPLSKEVLADAQADETVSFRPPGWYDEKSIELVLGVRACGVDHDSRLLALSDGSTLAYDQLLIATGAAPWRLPMLERFANVTMLRTLDDARELRTTLAQGGDLAIVGAGFIGQEVASAARLAGVRTTVIETAPAPLAHVLGSSLGGWFADLHRSEGVEMLLGRRLVGAGGDGRVDSLTLDDGRVVRCDHVVVGVGVRPDLDWLAGSRLDPAGVRVDVDGRSDVPGVYAAGDAAATFEPRLGRHVVGAHWEAAGRQGARAAKAMLGMDPGPLAPSSFWSDLYGTRIQYLGHAALSDAVSSEGSPDARDFTATFTRAGRPVALLLVGRPAQLPQARAVLAA